ncbi:hypothetical protein [Hymenobacter chitinivorans]|uniref:Uncharacterized protein n=1 Tax=Hymenobacter chitinivorans DSM 11115 TaxID=1121954 RepID=A0A2M9BNE9_9BACT|nr:hypothetical protein [Hymenobacter chitinivorans]PJJ59420.1 hypothetical protein CLV45_0837 [Hymenobacter chitinivorans DSM 11115]
MNTQQIRSTAPPVHMRSQALTRVWVVWQDGNKKHFTSFDTSGRYQVKEPREYGIRGLRKMVEKMGATVKEAVLYDNQTGAQEAVWVKNGVWVG